MIGAGKILKGKIVKVVGAILIFALSLSFACRYLKEKANPDREGLKKERVILRVEQREYTEHDFDLYVERQVGKKPETIAAAALSRLLDQFIEEKLWLEAAQQAGIVVSEEEKEARRSAALAEGQESSPYSEDDAYLTEKLMMEKYLQKLASGIDVSEDEIKNYYERNKREFLLPERVKVSQILVDNEAVAVRLQNQLKGGDEALFRRLARENSLGPEADRGGEMGIFKLNELPREIEKVIFSLKEGEISPVVESPYGFHIFRLDSRLEPKLLTLEEASEKIRAKLWQEKMDSLMKNHLKEIKARLSWEFFPERLSFPYIKENP